MVGGWDTDDKYAGRFLEELPVMFKLIEHYDFLWIDKYLYNIRRFDNERLTMNKNVSIFNELQKDLIQRLLIKWVDEYTAKFSLDDYGWLLTQLEPRKK